MKTIFQFLALAAAVSFASCTQLVIEGDGNEDTNNDQKEEVVLNENLKFTLEVTLTEADKAKVKVTNDGTSKDSWYGFVTEDMDASIDELMAEEVETLAAEGDIKGLKKLTSTTVTLRELTPETEYRYIVAGVSESGVIYTAATAVEFTTARAEVVYTENPAWTVAYTGAQEINGTVYEHTVTVTSTDDNKYFLTALSKEEYAQTDVKSIAEEQLADLKDYVASFNAQNGTNYTIDALLNKGNGMDAFNFVPGEWVALAIGVGEDGELSGLYAESEVITIAEKEVEYTENPAWNVAYTGEQEINGTAYEHTVTVTSTDDNMYFITAVSKEYFDQTELNVIAEEEIAYIKEYIDSYNAQNGTNYTIDALLYQGSGMDAFNFEAGEWIALAIGVGADGELSGLYAKSDVITIEEEEMTEGYAAWLGDWTFTGANGLTQQVTFSKGKANKSYKMTGYEGEATGGLEVSVLWDEENQCWYIFNQMLGLYSFQDGPGEIWFVGNDAEGNFYDTEELPICIGGMFEDGTLGAIPYSEEWENEDGTKGSYVVNSMSFYAYFESDDGWYYLSGTYQTGYPTFPLTITPTEATRSAASVKDIKVHANLVNTFKVFGVK